MKKLFQRLVCFVICFIIVCVCFIMPLYCVVGVVWILSTLFGV